MSNPSGHMTPAGARPAGATKSGYAAMLGATFIWGNLVLLFGALTMFPAFTIVAHRVIWAFFLLVLWLGARRRLGELIAALKNPRELGLIAIAAILVGANWLGFVWAVLHGRTLEAGLGYFIFPLFSAALGALFKGERLSRFQIVALALALLAVIILGVDIGGIPYIALHLALSFSLYGLVKSWLNTGATVSVTLENALLFVPMLLYLILFSGSAALPSTMLEALGLTGAGALTGLSLMLFTFASRNISLASIGMLFFLNPILQVSNAALFLGEKLQTGHFLAFPLIGIGCAIYAVDLYRQERSAQARYPIN